MTKEQMDQYAALAQLIGGVAALLAIIVGFFGVAIAVIQVRATRASEREASLKELIRDFGRLSMEYPQFARPSLRGDPDEREQEKYNWFVTTGLNICEEAFRFGRWSYWGPTVWQFVSMHKEWIDSAKFREETLGTFDKSFQRLVNEIVEGKLSKPERS
jgi:hypothetical protein